MGLHDRSKRQVVDVNNISILASVAPSTSNIKLLNQEHRKRSNLPFRIDLEKADNADTDGENAIGIAPTQSGDNVDIVVDVSNSNLPLGASNSDEEYKSTPTRRKSKFVPNSGGSLARRRSTHGGSNAIPVDLELTMSGKNGEEVSDTESEIDIDDEGFEVDIHDFYLEEHNDEGDSDVEYYQHKNYGRQITIENVEEMLHPSTDDDHNLTTRINNDDKSFTVISSTSIEHKVVKHSDHDTNDLSLNRKSLSLPPVGIGVKGAEGKAVCKLFGDADDLVKIAQELHNSKIDEDDLPETEEVTFGRGVSQVHPWTSRQDGGINARLLNEKRGKYIYFVGIIDILQQYNMSKHMETIWKVTTSLKQD